MEKVQSIQCSNTPESLAFTCSLYTSTITPHQCFNDNAVATSNNVKHTGSTLEALFEKHAAGDNNSDCLKSVDDDNDDDVKNNSINDSNDANKNSYPKCDRCFDLIIGQRGVCYLMYVRIPCSNHYNCNNNNFESSNTTATTASATSNTNFVSLNEKQWDNHVSFTPLLLCPSPCNKFLLVATDKHMHIILRTGSNQRVCTLSGHNCGDYGKPAVCWDSSGRYIYSNSENESTIYIYSTFSGKVAHILSGSHSGFVRGLACCSSGSNNSETSELLSVSYDKSLVLWK